MASRLGEAQGLEHMATCMTPSVLYATEMATKGDVDKRLDRAWMQALGETTQVGKANKWWSDEPIVSQQSLQWHGKEVPWSLQRGVRQARLAAKVAAAKEGLAAKLFQGQAAKQQLDPIMARGRGLLEKMGVATVFPRSGAQQRKWKKELQAKLNKQHLDTLQQAKQSIHNSKSDMLMWSTLGDTMCQAGVWEKLIPSPIDRVKVHKLKLGVVPFLRTSRAKVFKQRKGWTKLSKGGRDSLSMCPCGEGMQTPGHMWAQCPIAMPVLKAALDLPGPTAVTWNALPVRHRLNMAFAPHQLVGDAQLLHFKRNVISKVLAAMEPLEAAVGQSTGQFAQKFEEAILKEQVPHECNDCWIQLDGM